MFENLIRMFSSEIRTQKQNGTVEGKSTAVLTLGDKVRFKSDIETLSKEFGALENGKEYKLALARALEIMPRDRKRVDAYDALVKYLSERGITLIVESRKTKKNELSKKD